MRDLPAIGRSSVKIFRSRIISDAKGGERKFAASWPNSCDAQEADGSYAVFPPVASGSLRRGCVAIERTNCHHEVICCLRHICVRTQKSFSCGVGAAHHRRGAYPQISPDLKATLHPKEGSDQTAAMLRIFDSFIPALNRRALIPIVRSKEMQKPLCLG